MSTKPPPTAEDPRRVVSLATMSEEDAAELLAAAKAYFDGRGPAADEDEAEPGQG
jgi:hypothetical protein